MKTARPKPGARSPAPLDPTAPDDGERLQKILAAAGIGSRRKCEELILTGRVEVDRQVVTHLGAKADPQRQEIRLDGVALPRPRLVHYLVHKPVGVVSTNYDQSGRPRVIDLVPPRDNERLFAVGRLDLSSEGLMLLTNDGELANRLTHPRYGVDKTYQVEVAGSIDRDALAALQKGAHLAEGFARAASAKVRTQWKKSTLLEIVLREGRNREIRRLLARVGHKVLRLKRVGLGPLRLGELPVGEYRPIEPGELRELRQAAFAGRTATRRKRSGGPKRRLAPRAVPDAGPTIIGGDQPAAVGAAPREAARAPGKPRAADRRDRARHGKAARRDAGKQGAAPGVPAAVGRTGRAERGKRSKQIAGKPLARPGAKFAKKRPGR